MSIHDSQIVVFVLLGLLATQALVVLWLVHFRVPQLIRRAVEQDRADQAVAAAQARHDQVMERWPEITELRERTRRLADGNL